MIIPYSDIAETTLHTLIVYYVLREGTDYGDTEVPLTTKVQHVLQQLQRGDIVIVYSELHESINLLPKQVFLQQQAEQHTS